MDHPDNYPGDENFPENYPADENFPENFPADENPVDPFNCYYEQLFWGLTSI